MRVATNGVALWQRQYGGSANETTRALDGAADGGFAVAGSSTSFGAPFREAAFVLRADADGLVLPACPIVRDVLVAERPTAAVATDTTIGFRDTSAIAADPGLGIQASSVTINALCPTCALLACTEVRVDVDPSCAGSTQTFTASYTGGTEPTTVAWDFDGDTTTDATGNPVSTILPLGPQTVSATVTDSCADPMPQQCSASVTATVEACCAPLQCVGIGVVPRDPCAGEAVELTASAGGGEPPFTVDWDLDDDGAFEASGNPVSAVLPVGTTGVTARVTDACSSAQECTTSTDVAVRPEQIPPEVSDRSRGGAALRVDDRRGRVVVEQHATAAAYNVYAGMIGTWPSQVGAAAAACTLTAWQDLGDGRVALTYGLATGTWVLVTASSPCGEGPAGRTSDGAERIESPRWSTCGPSG